jgi:hypothetical protein
LGADDFGSLVVDALSYQEGSIKSAQSNIEHPKRGTALCCLVGNHSLEVFFQLIGIPEDLVLAE